MQGGHIGAWEGAEARGRNDDNDARRHPSRDQPGLMPSGRGLFVLGKGVVNDAGGLG